MEDVVFRMVLTGMLILISNVASIVVTIKWIRSDLKKHEEKHTLYVKDHSLVTKDVKGHIDKLYTRTNNMMTKQEIATLVKACIDPVSEDISELKSAVTTVGTSVVKMGESFARMDERLKIQAENRNSRSSD